MIRRQITESYHALQVKVPTTVTSYAAIVPRFTASISAVSSSLIIYIILRSSAKLSTIYHRLMFGMSLSALVGSLAIAPTTLLMPRDESLYENYGYNNDEYPYIDDDFDNYFDFPLTSSRVTKLGNVHTCNIQGFFSCWGMITMFAYIGMLCAYYACAIAFKMQEAYIQKYVEPWLHTTAIVFGFVFATLPISFDLYNPPSPSGPLYGWCTVTPYPARCNDPDTGNDIPCTRGEPGMQHVIDILLMIIICADFLVILVSLGLVVREAITTYARPLTILPDSIIRQIYARRQYLDHLERGRSHRDGTGTGNSIRPRSSRHSSPTSSSQDTATLLKMKDRRHAKVIIMQALAYIIAFLLGTIMPMIRLTGIVSDKDGRTIQIVDNMMLLFFPLQGFFNFVIFLAQRMYNYRRVNENLSIWAALVLIFWHPGTGDPVFISRIDMVDHDSNRYEMSIAEFGDGEDNGECECECNGNGGGIDDNDSSSMDCEVPGTDAACASSPAISISTCQGGRVVDGTANYERGQQSDFDEDNEQPQELDDFCSHSYPSGSWSCHDQSSTLISLIEGTVTGGITTRSIKNDDDLGSAPSYIGGACHDEENSTRSTGKKAQTTTLSAEMLFKHEESTNTPRADSNFALTSPGFGSCADFQIASIGNLSHKDASLCCPSSDDFSNNHDRDIQGGAKRRYYNYDQVY